MILFFKNLRNDISLYRQLLFIWFAFFILIGSSVIFINYIESRSLAASSKNMLDTMQRNIEGDLQEPEVLLNSIAYTIRYLIIDGEDAKSIEKYMREISDLIFLERKNKMNVDGFFAVFYKFDSLYIDITKKPRKYNRVPEQQEWYKMAIEAKGTTIVTLPYKGPDNNVKIDYAQSIFNAEGKPLGIVGFNTSISEIAKRIVHTSTEGGFGVIIDSRFNFIGHPLPEFSYFHLSKTPISHFIEELEAKGEIYGRESIDYKKDPSIFFIRRINNKNHWYIGTTTMKTKYFKPVKDMTFAISSLGLFLSTIFSLIFYRMTKEKNKSDERTKMMLDATPLGIIFWDKNYNIVDCNQEVVRLFELPSKQEFISKFSKLTPEVQPDGSISSEEMKKYFKKSEEKGYLRTEWMHQKLNGEPMPTEISFMCLRSKYDRNDIVFLKYIRDLREFKAMISEMRRIEIAEESNKAKSKFLAAMSHEIRTPMNAILGITEIQLQNETLPASIKEALERIYSSGYTLLGIINDILDLSKIEAGKMDLLRIEYETASLINNSVQLNILRIGSKLINFDIQIDENIPLTLLGDELRIKQILNNLLSNAFKYTKEGSVYLSIFVEPGKNDSEIIFIFRVSDTGIGMTEEQVNRLFEEYSRFNLKANRSTEGTGLGMNITKQLIDLMRGEILVESELNKGTTFTVRLPQGLTGAGVLGKELAENLQKFRTNSKIRISKGQIIREYMPYGSVLIVDDVETNLYVAKGLMLPYGLHIEVAISGFEAIEKIKQGKIYDVLFVDHMMPVMDGIEATKIIRGLGYSRPIVALTANAISGQADMFLQNGFDDFVSKPIDTRLLNSVLNKYIRDKQTPEILEEARKKKSNVMNVISSSKDEIYSIFIRDAKRTIAVLEDIFKKHNTYDEADIQKYIINVHAMKSALANIEESELSAFALKLEQLGRTRDIATIKEQTPKFLYDLRVLIEKIMPKTDRTPDYVDEDKDFLHRKLIAVRVACESYNKKGTKDALMELKLKNWSLPTREFLDSISEHLLYGDFDNAVEEIEKYLAIK